MAWGIAGGPESHSPQRIRFSLRGKLALLSLLLLALPWVGYLYVREMEHVLLAAQRQSVESTARAVATALHERPELFGQVRNGYASEVAPEASAAGRGVARMGHATAAAAQRR